MLQELKKMGLTQSMIAREMHVDRQTVNMWFTGKRTPSARSVNRMAKAISTLTGRNVPPAEVYNLITAVLEQRENEGGARDEKERN